MRVRPEQQALFAEEGEGQLHAAGHPLQKFLAEIDQYTLMPDRAFGHSTVKLIAVNEDQIAFAQGVDQIINIVASFSGQQIINFIGIVKVVGVHAEGAGSFDLLYIKLEFLLLLLHVLSLLR
ncbi:hypothetical protein D3C85_1268380 [compost metagenome]